MSIKIYNGYRLGLVNVFDIHAQVSQIFKPLLIQKIHQEALTDVVYRHDISHYDNARFRSQVDYYMEKVGFMKRFPDESDRYDWRALWLLYRSVKEYEKKEYNESDRNFEVVYFQHPTSKEIFCLAYGENELETVFAENFGEEYGYWNNSDHPEELTQEQWNDRLETWNILIDMNESTGVQGLSQKVLSQYDASLRISTLESCTELEIPSQDSRARRIAAAYVDAEYFAKTPKDDVNMMRFAMSDERRDAIALKAVDIVETLEPLTIANIVAEIQK